ncbi:hypothetical protein EYZ11_007160 [Aspergillus tanneri]|uniref:Uncharacterized protein n=1 Tax=Aspergillus tanneri TaxID=1220188 RepID=A0A4S3JG20_9EURO|nr:hypothetical protein EYZ11_007160 [Aspergillus tanneri]
MSEATGIPTSITMRSGDLVLTMPNLTRVDYTSETTESYSGKTRTRCAAPRNHETERTQYLRPEDASHIPTYFQGCATDVNRLKPASALGEALMGLREWNDCTVIHQRNITLCADDGEAMKFVNEVRNRLAREFHETLDLIELCHEVPAQTATMESAMDTTLDSQSSTSTAMIPGTGTGVSDVAGISDGPSDSQLGLELHETMEQAPEILIPDLLDNAEELITQTLDRMQS